MTLGGCVTPDRKTQRLAGSSWSSVATKAGSEDVSVCCCMFHLVVKARAFHWHARSCILFSKYPNRKSQIAPKGYKVCSRSVLQKVDAFHHWETSKGCVQISHTEVSRKQFFSLSPSLFYNNLCTGLCFTGEFQSASFPPPCCTETSMYRHHQQPVLQNTVLLQDHHSSYTGLMDRGEQRHLLKVTLGNHVTAG